MCSRAGCCIRLSCVCALAVSRAISYHQQPGLTRKGPKRRDNEGSLAHVRQRPALACAWREAKMMPWAGLI
ncbi:hypothetical protein V8E36_005709 [Tilletia maclaganii]